MSTNKKYPLNLRLRYAIDNFMAKGSSSIFLALLCLFLFGFLIMVLIRGIANTFLPDETLSSWAEIPWRVYVAVMEGSAAETDGDSNWAAKLTSIIGVMVGLILFVISMLNLIVILGGHIDLVLEKGILAGG